MPKVVDDFIIPAAVTVIGIGVAAAGILTLNPALFSAGISIGSIGLTMAEATAVSVVLKQFTSKPSQQLHTVQARMNININPQAMGKWVIGKTPLATDVVYEEHHGDKNKFITHVIAGAAHLITSYEEFYINDELITFGGGGGAQGAWNAALWRKTRLGTETDSALPAIGSDTTFSWPSTATGKGIAHYELRWHLSHDKLKAGIPTRITQVAKGAPVYDPRLDTTVGGSGSHRADDQTTWEYTNGGVDIGANWALVVLYYLLGWHTTGGDLVFGVGVDPADIDYDAFMEAANVCDELVDGIPRYHIGGIFETTQDHEQIIQQLEAAVGGKVSKFGGKYTIWAPNDDLASAALSSITENDLIRSAGVKYKPSGKVANLFNTGRGRYVEPDQLFQLVPYPEVQEASAVTEDGRERVNAQDFALIQDVSRSQRVERYNVRRSRFTAHWTFAMGPKGLLFKPFSVTTLNIQETNNEDVIVRIINMKYGMGGVVLITCIQEDSSIYDTTAPLGTPVTQLDPSSYDPTYVPDVANLTLATDIIQGTGGTISEAIVISWDDPEATVKRTEGRYKITAASNWIPFTATELTRAIVAPVEPGTNYTIEVWHVNLKELSGNVASDTITAGYRTVALADNGWMDDIHNFINDPGDFMRNNASGATIAKAQSDANNAIDNINFIISDSTLSPDEKPYVIREVEQLNNEQSGIDTAADNLSITTEKTSYDTALAALNTYLATLTDAVAWNDITGQTTIVAATYKQKFVDVYNTRQALLNEIAQVASTVADWASITGAAKPEDNATVGAKAGTNLKASDNSSLGDTDVITAQGTSAAFAGQGALATLNNITLTYVTDAGTLAGYDKNSLVYVGATAPNPATYPLWQDTTTSPDTLKHHNGSTWVVIAVLAVDLDALPDGSTRFAAAETGADKTSSHTAAGITGQGALATLNNITLTYVTDAGTLAAYDKNSLVYVGAAAPDPGIYPLWQDTTTSPDTLKHHNGTSWVVVAILATDLDALPDGSTRFAAAETGADKTSSHTAAGIAGQGDLAILNNSDLVVEQSTAPSHRAGKIWIDSDDTRIYKSDGSTWTQITAYDALLLLNAPIEADADKTYHQLAQSIYDNSLTMTVGNSGGTYGVIVGSYGSFSPDTFYSKLGGGIQLYMLTYSIGSSSIVTFKEVNASQSNVDNNFSSIQVNSETALPRSGATYTADDLAGHTEWAWGGKNTTGYPTSGDAVLTVNSG